MERTFLDRCRRLSTHAQTLMLLVFADDSLHHADLTVRPALGVGEEAFAEVERAGPLRVNGTLSGCVTHWSAHRPIRQRLLTSARRPTPALAQTLVAAGPKTRKGDEHENQSLRATLVTRCIVPASVAGRLNGSQRVSPTLVS